MPLLTIAAFASVGYLIGGGTGIAITMIVLFVLVIL